MTCGEAADIIRDMLFWNAINGPNARKALEMAVEALEYMERMEDDGRK